METISTYPAAWVFVAYVVVAVLASLAGVWGFNRLHRFLRHRAVVEEKLRFLKDETVRNELSGFLRKNMVIGDADIRQGIVFAPVPPERLEPIALALNNAAAMMHRMENRAADSLYIRLKNGDLALIDLDLDHLIDAARVMQRVAEDRRKSRSIYKGMTEEELLSLARAGLSQWYKDHGRFEVSNKIMNGDWDEQPIVQGAISVLDLTFKVKGARND